jgi:hypothetical protein
MMSSPSQSFWVKVYQARDKLVEQFLSHPEVSLIDIGYERSQAADSIVLQIHLRRPEAEKALNLPREIDGLPVRVIIADYKIE